MALFALNTGNHFENQKKQNGNHQSRQHIQRLAVLQIQDGKSRRRNQESAHDGDFRHQGICEKILQVSSSQIDRPLPAKKHRRRQRHADPVSGGEHGGCDKIQSCIGKQIRMISVESALHRP